MFLSVQVPRGTIDDELAAAQASLAAQQSPVHVPSLFLRMSLEAIRDIERLLHLNAGPLVGTDLAFCARARAAGHCRTVASMHDVIDAIPAAICGNAQSANEKTIAESVLLHAPNPAEYLKRAVPDCDFHDIINKLHACGCDTSPAGLKHALLRLHSFASLAALSQWVIRHEALPNFRIYEVISAYLAAFQEGIALKLKARQSALA